jgi:Alpha/beta hydrolase family
LSADAAGLDKAYAEPEGVYYDEATHTEYIKGSSDLRDWWDDLTKIPAWGDIHAAHRYQQAERAYQELLAKGKPVDRVVGHSLGGSVALQLQRDHHLPASRTFGAPVLDFGGQADVERYRHPLDPVSALDASAKTQQWSLNPHSHRF